MTYAIYIVIFMLFVFSCKAAYSRSKHDEECYMKSAGEKSLMMSIINVSRI